MSYPQQKSSISVLQRQEYFRLFTELINSGDIYEIDTSVRALAIGPNSDIQNVRVWYPSPQNSQEVESAVISVGDPFIGRMDALMGSQYPGLDSTSRILVASDDIIPADSQYFELATGEPDAADLIVWHRANIDLLCYHSNPGVLPQTRSERQWQHSLTIYDRGAGTGRSWYFFPHYRRKYFHARLVNSPLGAQDLTYEVLGVTFHAMQITAAQDQAPTAAFTSLATGNVVNNTVDTNNGTNIVLYSDTVANVGTPGVHPIGYYDYMCVAIAGTAFDGGNRTDCGIEIISTDWT